MDSKTRLKLSAVYNGSDFVKKGEDLMKKMIAVGCAVFMTCSILLSVVPVKAEAAGLKVGFVDLRKAFYDYEKAKTMDKDLNTFAAASQAKMETMVQNVSKLRDEMELLSAESRAKKEQEMDASVKELKEFDQESRQTILERKDNLFREVMDDIQKVVVDKGTKGGYDYILDSRNIMYAADKYDMTQEVVAELNK